MTKNINGSNGAIFFVYDKLQLTTQSGHDLYKL